MKTSFIALTTIALLLAQPVLADEKKAASAPASGGSHPLTIIDEGEGFALKEPKRASLLGENVGLIVSYDWGDGHPGTADVYDGKTEWLVRFPSKPPTGAKVTGTLQYLFSPSAALRGSIEAELATIRQRVIETIHKAVQEKDWKKAFTDASANLLDPKGLETVSQMVTDDGTPTGEAILLGIGLEKTADGNGWTPGKTFVATYQTMMEAAAKEGMLGSKPLGELPGALRNEAPADASSQDKECAKALTALKLTPEETGGVVTPERQRQFIEAVRTCHALEVAVAREEKADACVATEKAVDSALTQAAQETSVAKLMEARTEIGKCNLVDSSKSPTLLPREQALLNLVIHARATAAGDAAFEEKFKPLAKAVVEKIRLEEKWALALDSVQESRGYSVAAGALYFAHLRDLGYPVLVSICPFGCLRKTEFAWSDPWAEAKESRSSLLRALSFEVGIVSNLADKFVDPRRRDAPGYVLGASYNVLSLLRVSAGGYLFENQESRAWEWDGYLGLTLDAAMGAEILKLFGITVPVSVTGDTAKDDSKDTPAKTPAAPAPGK